MPVSKQTISDPPSAMISDDQNDPLDLFIRQAIGREDSPLQVVQLVHPFGESGLVWPMLTPVKVQLQKCDKCSMEFCSPMNYRRHKLTHRRSLNVHKESLKNRDLLGAFWDKLSLEEAGRVVSVDDISLEGVSGSLIVDAWSSSFHRAGVLVLPQVYSRAGCILLEIILAKASRPPISSQDLFSILDETSEGTFLSVGTAESVQKFIVDGGAEKVLELRNLVASTGLLFEKILVKAWVAEKDAEALRCQKLLVEEEEVAQKRQAQVLERKQRKKLRQKEQKEKGRSTGENKDGNASEKTNNNADALDSIANFIQGPTSAETSIPHFPFEDGSGTLTNLKSSPQLINYTGKEDELVESQSYYISDHVGIDSTKNVAYPMEWETNGSYQSTINTWNTVKSYRRGQVSSLGSQNLKASKLEAKQNKGPAYEMNSVENSGKVCDRKSKGPIGEESSRITIQNITAKSANDVESSRISMQNLVAKAVAKLESSRTTFQDIVAKKSNDESSRTKLKSIVSKGEINVESSSTTLQNKVSKSSNDENLRTSWKNIVSKGAIDVENSRTTLQNVVAKSLNDESSRSELKSIVYNSAITMESSSTTLQNKVAKISNDESSRTSWKNIVSKGAIDVESSRTTLQNVVAKRLNDESSRTSWKNIVSKGGIDVEISRTTLQNVVAKCSNDESSRTSWKNIVSKGAIGVESSTITLQNVIAKSKNDVRSSNSRSKNIVSKGVIDGERSRNTLQNIVFKSSNDESSRASLENIVSKGEIEIESSRTNFQNVVVISANDVEGSTTSLPKVVESNIDMSNCKLLVGSISAPGINYAMEKHVSQGATTNSSDKCVKLNIVLEGEDHPSLVEMGGDLHVQRGIQNSGENDLKERIEDPTISHLQSCLADLNVNIKYNNNPSRDRNVAPQGSLFPNFDVKAFLAQRWRDAIASDHVKLVLSAEPRHVVDGGKDGLVHALAGGSEYIEFGDAETSVAGVGSHVSFIKGKIKAKFRNKDPER